jgi:hypothetical protein
VWQELDFLVSFYPAQTPLAEARCVAAPVRPAPAIHLEGMNEVHYGEPHGVETSRFDVEKRLIDTRLAPGLVLCANRI